LALRLPTLCARGFYREVNRSLRSLPLPSCRPWPAGRAAARGADSPTAGGLLFCCYACSVQRKREGLLEKLAALLEPFPQVQAAYLFGSALHRADPRDLDLAVLGEKRFALPDLERIGLACEVALRRRVEVVDLRAAAPFFAVEVLRGQRFFLRRGAEVAVDEFELYLMRRAGDLAPVERERRRMLLGFDPEELVAAAQKQR